MTPSWNLFFAAMVFGVGFGLTYTITQTIVNWLTGKLIDASG